MGYMAIALLCWKLDWLSFEMIIRINSQVRLRVFAQPPLKQSVCFIHPYVTAISLGSLTYRKKTLKISFLYLQNLIFRLLFFLFTLQTKT